MTEFPASGFGHGAVIPDVAPIGLPTSTQVTRAIKVEVDLEIRCQGMVDIRTRPGEQKVCGKLLIEKAARPWQVKCPRCSTLNRSSEAGSAPGT